MNGAAYVDNCADSCTCVVISMNLLEIWEQLKMQKRTRKEERD